MSQSPTDYLISQMQRTMASEEATFHLAEAARKATAPVSIDPAYELRAMIAAAPTVDLGPLREALRVLLETLEPDTIRRVVDLELAGLAESK
jgi:hypothetical protein